MKSQKTDKWEKRVIHLVNNCPTTFQLREKKVIALIKNLLKLQREEIIKKLEGMKNYRND